MKIPIHLIQIEKDLETHRKNVKTISDKVLKDCIELTELYSLYSNYPGSEMFPVFFEEEQYRRKLLINKN